MFASGDVFAKPAVPAMHAADAAREPAFDPARIMASIGEAPYEWTIATDVLAWGANATEVLSVGSLVAISSGRNYAKLLGRGRSDQPLRCGDEIVAARRG